MRRRRRDNSRALTLLEVTISIALISMLLGALLTFFWQTLAIRDEAGKSAARKQIVQQVLERMTAELKATIAAEQVGFSDMHQFVGERRRVTFLFLQPPLPRQAYVFARESETAPWPRHDLYEVTYQLWIDPDEETDEGDPLVGGILRTQRQAIKPARLPEEIPEDEDLPYERYDLWSYELGYLEFRYFDGVEWSTTWQVTEGNALPHLIQITVGFDSLTREDYEDQDLQEWPIDQYPLGADVRNTNRFSTIVRLPAADEMFSARLNRVADEAEEVYEWDAPAEGEGGGGEGGS